MIQQSAMNYVEPRAPRAKQISHMGTNTKKVSAERGSRVHSFNAVLTDLQLARSRGRRAPRLRLPIRGFGRGSLVYVVSHGKREATGRDRNQKSTQMSTKSHLVIQGLHGTLSPVPPHMSDRDEQRATRSIANRFVARWTGGHSSASSICDAETAVGEWKKIQYETVTANVRDLSGLCSCL